MEDGRLKPEVSLDSLKRRLDDAKLRLDFASHYVKEVDNDHLSRITLPADPDAIEHAIRAKNSANLEYLRVLKIYEDFVARGKAAHNGAGPRAQSVGTEADPATDSKEP